VRPPTFLSSTFRLFFFSWVIFYCLPQAFFFISSLSLFIFVLPPSNVFVPRTLQRQVRVPTGATAGSLRRATYNAPRRRNHHRQSPPSPESRSPASGSDQHRSNYGQSFSFFAENYHQERTLCSVNLLPSCRASALGFYKTTCEKNCEGLATTRDCSLGPVKYFASKSTPCTTRGHALQYRTNFRVKNRIEFNFYI
jgi:hypothetical protein